MSILTQTHANLYVNQRFIHTGPSCGFSCYQVYLRGSIVVKFADSKVTINCLLLIMTTSNIQRYLGKSLSLKDSSCGRRSFQYHNFLSIYYFEVNIVIHSAKVKASISRFSGGFILSNQWISLNKNEIGFKSSRPHIKGFNNKKKLNSHVR